MAVSIQGGDLAAITGTGFDLLANPGGKFDLVPADECEDCCCTCDVEQDISCSATDADYGELVSQRAIQADVNLVSSLDAQTAARIRSNCDNVMPVFTCPNPNGTYVLQPVAGRLTGTGKPPLRWCEAFYHRFRVEGVMDGCTLDGGGRTYRMISYSQLIYSVIGFFPYVARTGSYTVASFSFGHSMYWADTTIIDQLDSEGSTSQSELDAFNLFYGLASNRQLLGLRSLGPLVPASTPYLGTWYMSYDLNVSQFPYRDVYRYVESAKCRPECNEIVQVGPPDWTNIVTPNTGINLGSTDGCLYSGNVTFSQV